MVAGPPEALRYRLFSLVAIVWALAMYGTEGVPSREVRRRISPWRVVGAAADRTWQTLRRWTQAARSQRLFPFPVMTGGGPREVAARATTLLMAMAPPHWAGAAVAEQAVMGAVHAAMGITPCAIAPSASTTQASF